MFGSNAIMYIETFPNVNVLMTYKWENNLCVLKCFPIEHEMFTY